MHGIAKATVTSALGFTPLTEDEVIELIDELDSNTTYKAGTGMTLSGTTFNGPVHVGAASTTPATNALI